MTDIKQLIYEHGAALDAAIDRMQVISAEYTELTARLTTLRSGGDGYDE